VEIGNGDKVNRHQQTKTIQTLFKRKEILDDWSIGFLESVLDQVEDGKTLSSRQLHHLERIESENTEEMLYKNRDFLTNWSAEHKEIWDICIAYYAQEGMYNRRSVLSTKEVDCYIPSYKEYKRVCENKYAHGVRNAWFGEPKFEDTSLVRIRATYASRNWRSGKALANKACMVLKSNSSAPSSHAKGAKVYLVMPLGEAQPLSIEERHLKKFKRS
jgi:hypothetical protein|tara:strand:+ start:1170 stop:1817 length:648 start_codon:yes stop_codon:yes gene_type:complete